jgi:hypothetical protein
MIFQIKKRIRRKNGKKQRSKCYSLLYRLGDMPSAKWLALKVSDKEAAEEKARAFRREFEAVEAGILLPKMIRDGAKATFKDHLESYLADLKKRGKSGENENGTKQILTRL